MRSDFDVCQLHGFIIPCYKCENEVLNTRCANGTLNRETGMSHAHRSQQNTGAKRCTDEMLDKRAVGAFNTEAR